jgi:hypothetical protein
VESIRTKIHFPAKTKHKQKICVFVLLCHNWELHRDAINKIKSFLNKQNFQATKKKHTKVKEKRITGKSYQQLLHGEKAFAAGFVSRLWFGWKRVKHTRTHKSPLI